MTGQLMRPRSQPTREYRNHHLDSTRWDGYRARPSDIVVTTPSSPERPGCSGSWGRWCCGPNRSP